MEQKESKAEQLQNLSYFTGTEHWYKHWIGLLYTDGVKFLVDVAGAYWLIDVVASVQHMKKVKATYRQTWILTVDLEASKGSITAYDGNNEALYTQELPYTDFPLKEIKLIFTNNVLCLPSED